MSTTTAPAAAPSGTKPAANGGTALIAGTDSQAVAAPSAVSPQVQTNVVAFGARVDVRGGAPAAFEGAPAPSVIFIGGGLTRPGLFDACWAALPAGGRLVANAVTAESEAAVVQHYSIYGGALRRYQHYAGEPVGTFTGWRPAMPVTQWWVVKQ